MNSEAIYVNLISWLYKGGTYSIDQVAFFVTHHSITPQDFEKITGQPYVTPETTQPF